VRTGTCRPRPAGDPAEPTGPGSTVRRNALVRTLAHPLQEAGRFGLCRRVIGRFGPRAADIFARADQTGSSAGPAESPSLPRSGTCARSRPSEAASGRSPGSEGRQILAHNGRRADVSACGRQPTFAIVTLDVCIALVTRGAGEPAWAAVIGRQSQLRRSGRAPLGRGYRSGGSPGRNTGR
jgi:hypothetical protein